MARFQSTIYKLGINPVIDPPEEVLKELFERAGKAKGPIPVCGKLNDATYVQTLVKYGGKWRLYINAPMLADSGLKVGDVADVEIEFDPVPREIPMPPVLTTALNKNKTAKAEFDRLSPSRKKEILRYLGSLKTQASVEKNVERVVRHLLGE